MPAVKLTDIGYFHVGSLNAPRGALNPANGFEMVLAADRYGEGISCALPTETLENPQKKLSKEQRGVTGLLRNFSLKDFEVLSGFERFQIECIVGFSRQLQDSVTVF